jgi:uncharacterized membrane protein YgaE (UPF0421/DUF939 family)
MWRWIEFTVLFGCCLLACEAAHSKGCLPPKDQIKLDSKREQIERFLMLAKIGERQAARLVHSPAQPTWTEAPTFGAPLDQRQILTVHDCVWSELLNELVKWKPQNLRDRQAIQEILRYAKNAKKKLNDVRVQRSDMDSRLQESLARIHKVEETVMSK